MSFANPTPLRLGMAGTLTGKRYRVAGRVVLGVEENGSEYFWNEFHLVSESGDEATLVYEETESGGEWRLFTLFDPPNAMSVREAAAKRVGDSIQVDGIHARISLVGESRVFHIEGQAPEGVEQGDIARYFNAESGRALYVVSWTGDEVEFYRGVNVSRGMVSSAFGIASSAFSDAGQSYSNSLSLSAEEESPNWFYRGAIAVVVIAVLIVILHSCSTATAGRPSVKKPAPAATLRAGMSGVVNGKSVRIRRQSLAEIAAVSECFDRHEFELDDGQGGRLLLLSGMNARDHRWILFTPLVPLDPLAPENAAALRKGDTINIDGHVAPIDELFRTKILQSFDEQSADLNPGETYYGFLASSGKTLLLVRWNQTNIAFYSGTEIPEKLLKSAF